MVAKKTSKQRRRIQHTSSYDSSAVDVGDPRAIAHNTTPLSSPPCRCCLHHRQTRCPVHHLRRCTSLPSTPRRPPATQFREATTTTPLPPLTEKYLTLAISTSSQRRRRRKINSSSSSSSHCRFRSSVGLLLAATSATAKPSAPRKQHKPHQKPMHKTTLLASMPSETADCCTNTPPLPLRPPLQRRCCPERHFITASPNNNSSSSSCRTINSRTLKSSMMQHRFIASFYVTVLFLSSFSTAIPIVRRQKRHIVVRPDGKVFSADHFHVPSIDHDGGGKEHDDDDSRRHDFAIKYLNEFGYLSTLRPTPRELKTAVESFQSMIGVPTTGNLNQETMEQMMQPRCGNNDVSRNVRDRRKRFVYISRWENKMSENNVLRLKWYIENYTSDIPKARIKKIVEKAFYLWSSQVMIQAIDSLELVFEEAPTEAEADITILWATGDHGDSHKFDGPGEDGSNILAHTFYPNYQLKGSLNGDIHFDDFEQWKETPSGSKEGASFPHVLVHEIGHTLGLGHSKKQQAIMFPIYRKDHLDLMQLDLDDKCAVNWSYIGASDLCLYIWLLSEVVPKKVGLEKGKESGTPSFMLDDNRIHFDSPLTGRDLLIERLRKTTIPTCGNGNDDNNNNRVRAHLENMLTRKLSFPRELARDYSGVICRFLDGLQKNYDLPATDNFHSVFRTDGTHSYFQGEERFEALERALETERRFDAAFFDKILEKFVAAGKKEEESS